jgi:transcription initiation factor IIE alpha subunit
MNQPDEKPIVRIETILRNRLMKCESCGRPFTLDRFEPDQVLCSECAEELGLERDGSESEDNETDDEQLRRALEASIALETERRAESGKESGK